MSTIRKRPLNEELRLARFLITNPTVLTTEALRLLSHQDADQKRQADEQLHQGEHDAEKETLSFTD